LAKREEGLAVLSWEGLKKRGGNCREKRERGEILLGKGNFSQKNLPEKKKGDLPI